MKTDVHARRVRKVRAERLCCWSSVVSDELYTSLYEGCEGDEMGGRRLYEGCEGDAKAWGELYEVCESDEKDDRDACMRIAKVMHHVSNGVQNRLYLDRLYQSSPKSRSILS